MANKVFIDNLLDPDTGDQGFFLGMNTDQCYPGMDLSLKFAEEIKGYTSVWKWIQARIKAGNIYGIHVGDYIPFNCTFLSTLSLRRATAKVHKTVGHFCAYETNFMEIASSC